MKGRRYNYKLMPKAASHDGQPSHGMPPARIRVLLVDDHPIIRHGLKQLINAESDMEVCEDVSDARRGLDAALRLKPDLVCVDIALKGSADGIDFIKNLKLQIPTARILVVSMHEESLYAAWALKAGSHGYLTKAEALSKIVEAIHVVVSGGIYTSEKLRQQALLIVSGQERKPDSPVDGLTDRELEILRLIGDGIEPNDMAATLNISVKTVNAHRQHIRAKLRLSGSGELAKFAVLWVENRRDLGRSLQ